MGPTITSGQAITLPHAVNAATLHDLAIGTWNMDTVNIRGINVLDIQDVTCYVALF
ncbi:hypothetical protein Tco_0047563, partial [Tanacetum coccineum]